VLLAKETDSCGELTAISVRHTALRMMCRIFSNVAADSGAVKLVCCSSSSQASTWQCSLGLTGCCWYSGAPVTAR
jgi:hypothetical protein